MFLNLQVVTVFLVAVAMSMALAHALELPGKLRLDRETYSAMQPIYYPGFTIGGGVGEGFGILATLGLLLATPTDSAAFPWTLVGFIAIVAMHAVYWIVTHPVNEFWLKNQDLNKLGAGFFGVDSTKTPAKRNGEDVWKRFRNRWEYSHVLRALLSAISLISLIIAVAVRA